MKFNYSLQSLEHKKVPELLETLKSLLPDSIIAYYWLLTVTKWAENDSELKIVLLCPNGETTDGSYVGLIDGLAVPNRIFGTIYVREENMEKMKIAIRETELIEWKRMKHFIGVWNRFVPFLADVIKEKRINFTENYRNVHITTIEKAVNLPAPKIPDNIRVGPLDDSYLDKFCDNWPHYDAEFRPVILKMLQSNPSVGVFVKSDSAEEELVSMAVQAEYGGVGFLQTLPEHQRKGYAEIVMISLTKSLAVANKVPFGFVILDNVKSSALFKKCQYEVIGKMCKVILNKYQ